MPVLEHRTVQPIAVALLTTLPRSSNVILFCRLCASRVALAIPCCPSFAKPIFFYLIIRRYGDAITVFVPCFLATSRECLAATDSVGLWAGCTYGKRLVPHAISCVRYAEGPSWPSPEPTRVRAAERLQPSHEKLEGSTRWWRRAGTVSFAVMYTQTALMKVDKTRSSLWYTAVHAARNEEGYWIICHIYFSLWQGCVFKSQQCLQ